MTPLIIILAVLAVVSNATSDEIRFHWSRLFAHWFPVGSKLYKWMCPEVSWKNKYVKSKVLTFLLSTLLVMFTDFWHLLKFITINCVFGIVLALLTVSGGVWAYVVAMIGLNIVWGILFETVLGIYGTLSDKYMK